MRLVKNVILTTFCLAIFYACSVEEFEEENSQINIEELQATGGDSGIGSGDDAGEDDTPPDNDKKD